VIYYPCDMKKQAAFSDEIRCAVDGSGMSRYEICKRIGLDQAVMSRFMTGKSGLGLKTLDRLAPLLDLHISTGAKKGRRK